MNLSLPSLRKAVGRVDGDVYCYVVATVVYDGERFRQPGSGPNFEGGCTTLCTCKHWMRSYRRPDEWEGAWIAGVTGKTTAAGRANFLFYLMQVERAFASQRDLYAALPRTARDAKAAIRNRLGDVFKPNRNITDDLVHSPSGYAEPVDDHSHADNWQEADIEYLGCGGRYPALLVGKPERSFLWSKPMCCIEGRFRQKGFGLGGFLDSLRTATE